jgi:hypothetical protein
MAKRLFDAGVKDGSVPAMIFWLKTRARWRETDNQSVDSDGSITINVIKAKKPENVD